MRRDIWITHQIMYEFDESIGAASLSARLRPIEDAVQKVMASTVRIRGYPYPRNASGSADLTWSDGFRLWGPLRRIGVTGEFQVRCDPSAVAPLAADEPIVQRAAPSWARRGSTIWNWARQALPDTAPRHSDIDAFMELIRAEFTLDAQSGRTATIPRFFARRRGVCLDHLRLAAECLRARGVPVQLVFGYLIKQPVAGQRFEGEGQTHTWLSTWDPASGWRGIDPTTGLPPPHHHVALLRGDRLAEIQPVSMSLHGLATHPRPQVHETVVQAVAPS